MIPHLKEAVLRHAFFLVLPLMVGLCVPAWAEDCGARGYDGENIVKFECVPATDSPLQIRATGGTIWGLKLVDPADPNAHVSKFRAAYIDASGFKRVKALGYIPEGNASCEELQMIGYHPAYPRSKQYVQADNIDCSKTNPDNTGAIDCSKASITKDSLWKCGYAARYPKGFDGVAGVNPATGKNDDNIPALGLTYLGEKGFRPLGPAATPFTGTYDGNLKKIKGLYINRPTESCVGLFGATQGWATYFHHFKDLSIENAYIVGNTAVGGFMGTNGECIITNVHVTGTVKGVSYVGGLIGNNDGSMINSSATGTVTGTTDYVGGLVGFSTYDDFYFVGKGEIIDSHADVTVSAGGVSIGGLAGQSQGILSDSYATGDVSGGMTGTKVGGLLGDGFAYNSYATGSVTGKDFVGGLIGSATLMLSTWEIKNSYATGPVTGDSQVGGLVGGFTGPGKVINSYATGSVSGNSKLGGLVGSIGFNGKVTNSYATGQVTGSSAGGLVGYSSGGTLSHTFATGKVTGTTAGGLIGNRASGTVVDSWWDKFQTANAVGSGVVTGITSFVQSNDAFSSSNLPLSFWDFTNTWQAVPCNYPNLKNVGGDQHANKSGTC